LVPQTICWASCPVPLKHLTVLHGARDMRTCKELDPVSIAKQNNWECVRSYPMDDLGQVINAAKQLNPAL